jgi:uncharacterized protein DUF222
VALSVAELARASTAEVVAAAAAMVAELAARPAPESPAVAMELAETLGWSLDQGEAALATLIRAVDGSAEPQRWGYNGPLAWLRHRLGMRTGRAKERLTLARQLPRLRLTRKLLAAGELSYGYAATITESLARLTDADAASGERILLELAGSASVNDVAKAGGRITDVIAERDGRERPPGDARRGSRRSWVQRSKSLDDGMWIKGWLSAEHAAVWDSVIEPLTTPTGAADDRDHAERTADALHTVLSNGHRRTSAIVVIDLATLLGGDQAGRLLSGGRISPERARQIALTAGVSALILGLGGQPLYLGRTARFASPAQTRVLRMRYESCAVHGCDIPSGMCEIHHTGGGWKAGTPTDVDRLAPLCSFHNAWVEDHPGRIEEHRDSGGRHTLHLLPPWEDTGQEHACWKRTSNQHGRRAGRPYLGEPHHGRPPGAPRNRPGGAEPEGP